MVSLCSSLPIQNAPLVWKSKHVFSLYSLKLTRPKTRILCKSRACRSADEWPPLISPMTFVTLSLCRCYLLLLQSQVYARSKPSTRGITQRYNYSECKNTVLFVVSIWTYPWASWLGLSLKIWQAAEITPDCMRISVLSFFSLSSVIWGILRNINQGRLI